MVLQKQNITRRHYTQENVTRCKMLNFNRAFKETQDFFKIPNEEFALQINRSLSTLSRIRGGKSSPTLIEFSQMIEFAEECNPGFRNEFLRRLYSEGNALSPEEFINSLDSEEVASLLSAIGKRIKVGLESVRYPEAA
jgi:hypothetical protein